MVKWSNSAKHDLRQIYEYISNDSKIYGRIVVDDIVRRTEQLNQFVNSGKIVEELNNPSIREILIYSYRLIYQVKSEEEVEVLTIVHARRKFILTERD
jgi:toxin ParE1/3/4